MGKYVRSQGARNIYQYDAQWIRDGERISWLAIIERAGSYCGTPRGTLYSVPGGDPSAKVRDSIEAAIENLTDVNE